jgi:hypothetical protein
MAVIQPKARKALPRAAFALPATRQYPIHDAAHARNAMARLQQNKRRLTPDQYATAKRNIRAAFKKFGIETTSDVPRQRRGRLHLVVDEGRIEVRHMADAPAEGVFVLPAQPIGELP